eukprot:TRINITY_DN41956_c0_g1_i2.p1 TRINITY_DN41956_c0_g1~~TRINITY_DN41956_c0_g1_i2.p1  ORF type:complete len:243 (-),score=17.62 TRINITY_DN41956_c0_g1_i2:88-816(-)
MSGARYVRNDGFALSQVLEDVRSMILEHEPLRAAFLLTKVAELVQQKGFMLSLGAWSDVVDEAAIDARMGSRPMALLQESVQMEARSRLREEPKPPLGESTPLAHTASHTGCLEEQADRSPLERKTFAVPPIEMRRPEDRLQPTVPVQGGSDRAAGVRGSRPRRDQAQPSSAPSTTDFGGREGTPPPDNWRAQRPSIASLRHGVRVNELRDSLEDLRRVTVGSLVRRASEERAGAPLERHTE